jgi:hypothetical protein
MTTKTNKLLQSDYLNMNNYKSIEALNEKTIATTDNIGKAPITPGDDMKNPFILDGKIANVDNEMLLNNNYDGENESEQGLCFKVFCSGLNFVIFSGIGLCLFILFILLILRD